MKKSLLKMAIVMLVLTMVLVLALNLKVQWDLTHQKFQETSETMFEQVENLIRSNMEDIQEIRAEFSENCLESARVAAYVLQARPELAEDLAQLRALAKLLDVDELHLFDPEGKVYFGTHPEYYHYTFDSGEQIAFFQPMLEDRTLEMCQEITPNTAEGKLMQYAAVWSEDGSMIVQIGMEPVRVQQAMEGRTLATLFASMPTEKDCDLYAIDPNDGRVVASTVAWQVGLLAEDIGFDLAGTTRAVELSNAVINGVRCCVAVCQSDSLLLVRTSLSSGLRQQIWMSTGFLALYVLLIFLAAVAAALLFIDRRIVRKLAAINQDLREIGKGRLDQVPVSTAVPELEELCIHINDMLTMVRETVVKASIALERSKLPIGIFEYPTDIHPGFATSRVREILMLKGECQEQEQACKQIADCISELKEKGRRVDDNVYELSGPDGFRFIRLEEMDHKKSHLVVLVDVTTGWRQQEQLRYQRDRDELTELYNRRGFYHRMEQLMQRPDALGSGALVMLDADGLKMTNDTYGHAQGDQYLKKIAEILKSFPEEHVVPTRLGGDEFAVFFYGYPDQEVLERALMELTEENGRYSVWVRSCDKQLKVVYSIGWAQYPGDSEDYRVLLHLADQRMYENKRLRKGEGAF